MHPRLTFSAKRTVRGAGAKLQLAPPLFLLCSASLVQLWPPHLHRACANSQAALARAFARPKTHRLRRWAVKLAAPLGAQLGAQRSRTTVASATSNAGQLGPWLHAARLSF